MTEPSLTCNVSTAPVIVGVSTRRENPYQEPLFNMRDQNVEPNLSEKDHDVEKNRETATRPQEAKVKIRTPKVKENRGENTLVSRQTDQSSIPRLLI